MPDPARPRPRSAPPRTSLPRVRLAHLPTPLEEAPRFAAQIGGGVRVFVKRDDCTGLLLGGNKARHNEFLLGDAVDQGCDMVVWGAGVQSNNCRQTAAGCAKLGLECRLYLSRGALPDRAAGEPAARLPRRGEGRVHRRGDRPGAGRAARGEGRRVPPGGAEAVLLGPAAGRAAGGGQLRPVHGRDRRATRGAGAGAGRALRLVGRGDRGRGRARARRSSGCDVPGPADLPDALAVAHPDAPWPRTRTPPPNCSACRTG